MSEIVSRQLRGVLHALESPAPDAVTTVIEADATVNDLDRHLNEVCTLVIARHQPTARDLRMILSMLRAATDLERVGDEACAIARLAADAQRMPGALARAIQDLGATAAELLEAAVTSFLSEDAERARSLHAQSEQVDAEAERLMREFLSFFLDGSPGAGPVAQTTLILRALERVADHAMNLCEHTVYLVTGSDLRHYRNEPARLS
jgi:phosphate transport system protein